MVTNIVSIGNSQGVRIPKPLLDQSGLHGKVELQVKKGEIRIVRATEDLEASKSAVYSEGALSDWNREEEDEAWKSLQ